MTSIISISPIVLCAIVILLFRRSAIMGGVSGIALSVLLIMFDSRFQVNADEVMGIVSATAILTLSAAFVIVPGLYLNATLRGQGILDDLVDWIETLPFSSENKVLILLLGLLPAIEALTGFGVSLFIAVPIFFRLFPPRQAYRLSMLGMNIMPWGTLALATTVGASISGYSLIQLGPLTALTSSLVFPVFGLAGLYVINRSSMLSWHGLRALGIGACLSLFLYLFNTLGFVETAGIMAGAMIGVLSFLLLRSPKVLMLQMSASPQRGITQKVQMFLPYALVLGLIVVTRAIDPLYDFLTSTMVLSDGRTRLSVLASPGLVLALVSILMLALRPVAIDHKAIWGRSRVAVLGLALFILLAQLMNAAGMISTLAQSLVRWAEGTYALVLLTPLIGMLSGFMTGSNLSGNALLMNVQQHLGEMTDQGLLFSAMQNSAAGHAVFTSLPIIVLVMTIARDLDTSKNRHHENAPIAEHELLRFGLTIGFLVYVALTISFSVLNTF